MIINPNSYSILEILDMIDRKELIVNKSYQRHAGLWPVGASSYFIDTIFEGYPFPKIYLYEFINPSERKIKKELVDGQQRITAIRRFINNEFPIKGDSVFSGMKFSDIDTESQNKFLYYSVSVDVIRNATKSEILQMFRRMNAYTQPLNNAEKRHSLYSGFFKWFVNEVADNLNDFFIEYGVFTEKQIVRMQDAEFVTELVIAIEHGIVSSSPKHLSDTYKKYDEDFPLRDEYFSRIKDVFDFIITNFSFLRNTYMMKPYALHSLFIALYFYKFGLDNFAFDELQSPKCWPDNLAQISSRLELLNEAHEDKAWGSPYYQYVYGIESSTNKARQRLSRFFSILDAFGYDLPEDITGYKCAFN